MPGEEGDRHSLLVGEHKPSGNMDIRQPTITSHLVGIPSS